MGVYRVEKSRKNIFFEIILKIYPIALRRVDDRLGLLGGTWVGDFLITALFGFGTGV